MAAIFIRPRYVKACSLANPHDNFMTWKYFPHLWTIVWRIYKEEVMRSFDVFFVVR